jgi:hypothetical protein
MTGQQWDAIITPDKFFSMLLSLEIFVFPDLAKDVSLNDHDGLGSLALRRIMTLTDDCSGPRFLSSSDKQGFSDMCWSIIAAAQDSRKW